MKETTDDIEIKRQRRARRLSRPVRKALNEFHRGHQRRHFVTSMQYISHANAVVIGNVNSRGLNELQVFIEGARAYLHDIGEMSAVSHRYFDDVGIADFGRHTGFITTYQHPKEDDAMTEVKATDKPLEPYVIVERSVFDRLFDAISDYDRIGRLENGYKVVDAASALRIKINNPGGGSPIKDADVVCADEPQNFVRDQSAEDKVLDDTRYTLVPTEAVKALSKRRREWLATQDSVDGLLKARDAYMQAARDLLEEVDGGL